MATKNVCLQNLICDPLLPGINDLAPGRGGANLRKVAGFERVTNHNPHVVFPLGLAAGVIDAAAEKFLCDAKNRPKVFGGRLLGASGEEVLYAFYARRSEFTNMARPMCQRAR
jgi:hypothetical protein